MLATVEAPALAIDVTRLIRRTLRGRRPTGIDRVTLAYVRHFGPGASALVGRAKWAAELGPRASRFVFEALLGQHAAGGSEPMAARAWRHAQPQPPVQTRQGRFVLHTGHSGLESPKYLPALLRRGLRPIVLVHDLIPLMHPRFCREGEPARHLARMQHTLAYAAGVVCNSEATLGELSGLARHRGWQLPPSVVAHLGVDAWAQPGRNSTESRPSLDSPGSPDPVRPYFVCIGTLEPRKNHMLLLRVWETLAQRLGSRTPDLILLGQRGWMFDGLVAALQASPVTRQHIHELRGCQDAQMRRWLLGAQALLMPSLAEGFGMPVAEALACGVPVIAGALPVYREFAGSVPDYLDPQSHADWVEAVEAYADSSHWRRTAQLDRITELRLPSWRAHFEKVEDLLARLSRKAGPQ
jgi:glycosyltransferase involved in cell wall biosynthesis